MHQDDAQNELLNELSEPYLVLNLDGTFIFANKACRHLFLSVNSDDDLSSGKIFDRDLLQAFLAECTESSSWLPGKIYIRRSSQNHGTAFDVVAKNIQIYEDRQSVILIAFRASASGQTVWELNERILTINSELNKQKNHNEQLRDGVERVRAVTRELYHRTKNNMQIISSFVNLEISKCPDFASRQLLEDVNRRIMAIAAAHDAATELDAEGRVDAENVLGNLLRLLRPQLARRGGHLRHKIEPLLISIDKAVALSLIVNEAVCDLIKTSINGRKTEVIIDLSSSRGMANLKIGGGCRQFQPSHDASSTGTSLRLICGLANQMGGHFEYAAGSNLALHVEFPIRS